MGVRCRPSPLRRILWEARAAAGVFALLPKRAAAAPDLPPTPRTRGPSPPAPPPLQLRGRVADYLAHHLSNFQWLWGWERWASVAAAPPGDARRAFCEDVLRRMVALSYWEHLKEGWAQAVDPQTREATRIKKARARARRAPLLGWPAFGRPARAVRPPLHTSSSAPASC